MEPTTEVSVVVPVFESASSIAELVARTEAALQHAGLRGEVVLVDDASTDDSWATITSLVAASAGRVGIRLASNCGQVAACVAGFAAAGGEVLVTIDADLENRPEDIPRLVAAVQDGAGLVGGRRTARGSWTRALGSLLFNARVRRAGFTFRDVGCGLIAVDRSVARSVLSSGGEIEGLNFKPTLARRAGRYTELDIGTGPKQPSNHPASAFLRWWLAFEAQFTGSRRLLSWTVAATGLGAGIRSARRRRSPAWWQVSGWVALVALRLLLERERRVARRRPSPLYEVAERVG